MNKHRAYNDYHSIWKRKTKEAVKIEIEVIQNAYEELERYGHRNDLHPSDKLDLLFAILQSKNI